MKKSVVLGALFVGAFVAAVFYFKPEPATLPAPAVQTAPDGQAGADSVRPSKVVPRSRTSNDMPATPQPAGSSPVPQDPRLAALQVSPEDGLIEFVRGPDDRVIAEIDNDASSLGFRKPRREYTYAGGKVVGLTTYRYYPDYVEISRTAVSYKPDGGIDRYEESTSHEPRQAKTKGNR